ncbi:hypothetical protein KUTeg_019056 [Tegillarca granosa]|uniref:PLAC domain-containing protein n=1 Tax=Tegillarca granosa TaxID=220873 RepID=A0ABQ9EBV7_TEGGR|nr:hypothetical protein KUTeg_019056 [Tegillarca granosa]
MQEVSISPNYLAIRDIQGKYYLNGDWHLHSEGAYMIAGVRFLYRRSYREPESIVADGPTDQDIVLVVLSQGKNPGIFYTYTLPKVPANPPVPQYNYTWSIKLTSCSQSCAGGEKTSTAHCYRGDGEEVDPRLCDRRLLPKTGISSCNIQPCRPRWDTGQWSQCSQKCGGGYQKRKLYCRQKVSSKRDRRVSKRRCLIGLKPARKIPCNTQECPPRWHTERWSQCSATCGKGTKSRQVSCQSMTSKGLVKLPNSMCQHQSSPSRIKRCYAGRCPVEIKYQWIVSSWSQCTVTCGEGVRSRVLKCGRQDHSAKLTMIDVSSCKGLTKPAIEMRERCNTEKCEDIAKPYWHLSPWSKCSVTCGNGVQTRLVHCIDEATQELSEGCNDSLKPVSRKSCTNTPCPTPDPLCTDSFKWCYLVPKHNICGHHFYGTKCCASCRGG